MYPPHCMRSAKASDCYYQIIKKNNSLGISDMINEWSNHDVLSQYVKLIWLQFLLAYLNQTIKNSSKFSWLLINETGLHSQTKGRKRTGTLSCNQYAWKHYTEYHVIIIKCLTTGVGDHTSLQSVISNTMY